MRWQNITAKDLNGVVRKLSLESSPGKGRNPHPVYWYSIDGKKSIRITMPNIHGGSGSISTGFLNQIRNSFMLDTVQFKRLVECPLSKEEYEMILREKLKIT